MISLYNPQKGRFFRVKVGVKARITAKAFFFVSINSDPAVSRVLLFTTPLHIVTDFEKPLNLFLTFMVPGFIQPELGKLTSLCDWRFAVQRSSGLAMHDTDGRMLFLRPIERSCRERRAPDGPKGRHYGLMPSTQDMNTGLDIPVEKAAKC